ncbi:MAG: hypothetical protein MUP70_07400 [Candidatus Aminicenantes bacterium]|nr:hypothetical protein [Candidatus Aminicenantes bacterium]
MGTTTLRLPDEKLRLIRAISGYENIPLSRIFEGLTDEYIQRYRETREILEKKDFLESCQTALAEIRDMGGLSVRDLKPDRIAFSPRSGKDFLGLSTFARNKITRVLTLLSEEKDMFDSFRIKSLTGDLSHFYRIREGTYRIIFAILKEQKIAVVSILTDSGDPG